MQRKTIAKKFTARTLAVLLALTMLFSLIPMTAFAQSEDPAISGVEDQIAPEEGTDLPPVDPEEPVVDTEEPVVDNEEPVVDPEEPVVDPEEPVVDPEEPAVEAEEPVATPEEPEATPEEADEGETKRPIEFNSFRYRTITDNDFYYLRNPSYSGSEDGEEGEKNEKWVEDTTDATKRSFVFEIPADTMFPTRVWVAYSSYSATVKDGNGRTLNEYYGSYSSDCLQVQFDSWTDVRTLTLENDYQDATTYTMTLKQGATTQTQPHFTKFGLTYKGVDYPAISNAYYESDSTTDLHIYGAAVAGTSSDEAQATPESLFPFNDTDLSITLPAGTTYDDLYDNDATFFFEVGGAKADTVVADYNGEVLAQVTDKKFSYAGSNYSNLYLGAAEQLNTARTKYSVSLANVKSSTQTESIYLNASLYKAIDESDYDYFDSDSTRTTTGDNVLVAITGPMDVPATGDFRVSINTSSPYKLTAIWEGFAGTGTNLLTQDESSIRLPGKYTFAAPQEFTVTLKHNTTGATVVRKLTITYTAQLSNDNNFYISNFLDGATEVEYTQLWWDSTAYIDDDDDHTTRYFYIDNMTANLASLAVDFSVHEKAMVTVDGVAQVDKVTTNNFTGPMTYTVKAENGDVATYTYYLFQKASGAKLHLAGQKARTIDKKSSHDVVFMNLGDAKLTGLAASLSGSGAQYFELHPYWTVDTTKTNELVAFANINDIEWSQGGIRVKPKSDAPAGKHTFSLDVTSANGGSESVSFTWTLASNEPVTEVTLNETSLELWRGESFQLEATSAPADANGADAFDWNSSDEAVAVVDGNGKVTAIGKGTTTITVIAGYSRTGGSRPRATCKVTVADEITSVELNVPAKTLKKGKSFQLTATVYPQGAPETEKAITWKSSKASIVKVDDTGKVKAVKKGSATITATTSNGKKASIKVTVGTPVSKVAVKKVKSKNIKQGNSVTLTATVSPSSASNKKVLWSSDNEAVATVSSKGKVKALSAGKVKITVTSQDGLAKKASVTLTVKPKVSSVSLNLTEKELKKGGKVTLKATVLPADAYDKSVSWKSSNKKVATVSSKGKVKAVKKGTAKITVTTKDGKKKATCTITVK